MSSKRKDFDFVGGGNVDQSWMGGCAITTIIISLLIAIGICWLTSCSPRIVEKITVETVYKDRIVHDTTTVEIPYEVEKIVTRDTVSHIENKYAKSDAKVTDGFLYHSLESKPQIIKVPFEVHVTDTLYKEAQIIEKEVKVEKPLSWWQKFRIGAFWWLVAALGAALLWIFRKPLLKLFGVLI